MNKTKSIIQQKHPGMPQKHLARTTIVHFPDGRSRCFRLAVTAFLPAADGCVRSLLIKPYSAEEAGVTYHDQTLHLYLSEEDIAVHLLGDCELPLPPIEA